MISERLYIAKNILKNDGTIWINIDDNEVHNNVVCPDIRLEYFADDNFVHHNFASAGITGSAPSGDNRTKKNTTGTCPFF